MPVFKIQKIRSCEQCGDLLAKKCARCVKHPERVPRVITYYQWPKILAVCPCTCSVLIQCQRPDCTKTRWVNKTHSREGLSKSENLYCSRQCNLMRLAAEKTKELIEVACFCGCSLKVKRKPSALSPMTFARPDHYFAWLRRTQFNRKQVAEASAKEAKAIEDRKIDQACEGRCGKITTHLLASSRLSENRAACLICGHSRAVNSKSVSGADAFSLSHRGSER